MVNYESVLESYFAGGIRFRRLCIQDQFDPFAPFFSISNNFNSYSPAMCLPRWIPPCLYLVTPFDEVSTAHDSLQLTQP